MTPRLESLWQRVEGDWRKLVDAPDIDAIDICSPNNTHHEIAVAAAAAGKIILCEKPFAMNLAEARNMTRAAEASGKPTMVWFIIAVSRPSPWRSRSSQRDGWANLSLPRRLSSGLDHIS